MPEPQPLTIAILAGGKGVRMGVPKDRLSIEGRPILLHLLDRLNLAVPTLLVTSAARPQPLGHEAFDRVAVDAIPGAGPLAGLAAALSSASTPLVAVLSVDMPWIGADQVAWLSSAIASRRDRSQPSVVGLQLLRTHREDVRQEPFPAIYHRTALPLVERWLDRARLTGDPSLASLHRLSEDPGIERLHAPAHWPGDVWLNLNRPEDLLLLNAQIL